MGTTPPLLPLFRSQQQATLLGWVLDHPDREVSISELADRLRIPVASAHREVVRAEHAGLIRSRRQGNLRLISANTESVYFDGLRQILTRAFGPPWVLADALRRIPGIDAAYIHGSWAARWHGHEGHRDVNDIDLLILGEPELSDVYAATAEASSKLGRDVQVSIRPADWLEAGDGSFHATVAARPVVGLELAPYSSNRRRTNETAS